MNNSVSLVVTGASQPSADEVMVGDAHVVRT